MCPSLSSCYNVYASLSAKLALSVKINDEYGHAKNLPSALLAQQGQVGPQRPKEDRKLITAGREYRHSYIAYEFR